MAAPKKTSGKDLAFKKEIKNKSQESPIESPGPNAPFETIPSNDTNPIGGNIDEKETVAGGAEPKIDKEVPNPLHDLVLKKMLEYRERKKDFVFWLRQINHKNRLNEGYWFQGDENYVHVGFYTAAAGDYSTQSVGFKFQQISTGEIALYFIVLHRYEEDIGRISFYKNLRDLLEAEFSKKIQDYEGDQGFEIELAERYPFDTAFKFLDDYKELMDELVKKLSIDDMVIQTTVFENRLKNTLAIRNKIKKTATKKNRNQDIMHGRSYNHVTASEMPPVIGAAELAHELSDFLVRLKGEAPILIGLFGKWGRGKTFLFDQIWKIKDTKEQFYKVDFHAWKHQKTPASWGYMYEAVAKEYYKHAGNWVMKRWAAIKLNYRRINNWELFVFVVTLIAGGVGWSWVENYSDKLENIGAIYSAGTVVGVSALFAVIARLVKNFGAKSSEAKALYKKYATKHSYSDLLGIQAEVQNELKTLLTTWIKIKDKKPPEKRILLFVDDVDRCSEDRIIEVVDSLRVMLEDPEIARRIIVVMAVDERILRRAIRLKYKNMLDENSGDKKDRLNTLTREYLDKLFLSGIKLGDLYPHEREAIFGALTEGKVELEMVTQPIDSRGTINDDKDSPEEKTVIEPVITQTRSSIEVKPKEEKEIIEYEITLTEEKILRETIKNLEDITPRQIRIFYLRYILGRDFLRKLKGQSTWSETEIRALVGVIAYVFNKDIIDKNISDLVKEADGNENFQNDWGKLRDEEQDKFIEVLDMVVPY